MGLARAGPEVNKQGRPERASAPNVREISFWR
jgi:hypothetical protein